MADLAGGIWVEVKSGIRPSVMAAPDVGAVSREETGTEGKEMAMAKEAEDLQGRSTLRALKKLSARGVFAEAIEGGEMAIIEDRSVQDGTAQRGEIRAATWAELMRRGWVVSAGEGRWRLSNAGRIHLKRLMSRGRAGDVDGTSHHRPSRLPQMSSGPQVNVAESPLAWLLRRTDRHGRPLISQAQFEAGERLRSDFERGSMMVRVTANWSSAGGVTPGSSGPDREIELQTHAIAARERVRAALAAVGQELSGILIDVCCHLKGLADIERGAGWPQRTAKVVLLLALTTLARHYGLIRVADEGKGHERVRHWGAADYRPDLTGGAAS